MDIADTRKCNLWNLQKLAHYLDTDVAALNGYYDEILADQQFLAGLNDRMRAGRENGFTKGIFKRDSVDSADWFAFERVLLYVLLRHLKPAFSLETGVFYGGNTAFMLAALHRNGAGKLISIDLPDSTIRKEAGTVEHARHPLVGDSEFYDKALKPGFLVPDYLKPFWEFVEGSSLDEIPKRRETFGFYMHDSDHSHDFLVAEIAAAKSKLSPSGVVVVDDIDWSNAFFAFCVEDHLAPVLFTDNGKDNLRVRTGLAMLDHPWNRVEAMTGRL